MDGCTARSPYARSPVQVAEAYVAGRQASSNTTALGTCPYLEGTDEFGAWHRGYSLDRILSRY